MKPSIFTLKSVNLDSQRWKDQYIHHKNYQSLSLGESELEQLLIDRTKVKEPKNIFFLKVNPAIHRKVEKVQKKTQELPMLTTLSKGFSENKKTKDQSAQHIALPLTKSFARALSSYKSKYSKKQQNKAAMNDYLKSKQIKKLKKFFFHKQEVLQGNKTIFYSKDNSNRNLQFVLDKKMKEQEQDKRRRKLLKNSFRKNPEEFSPWDFDSDDLIQ